MTDFESWARMRELHGLSFEEACEVWIQRDRPPAAADAAGCLTLRRTTWDGDDADDAVVSNSRD